MSPRTLLLSEWRVGRTRYPLRRSIRIQSSWTPAGWAAWCPELCRNIEGVARDLPAAIENWKLVAHANFQELYGKRPFQMSNAERHQWCRFNELVDVSAYRASVPRVAREIGQVRCKGPHPTHVIWVDGRRDRLNLRRVPAEMAAYKPGQWFEGEVQRDVSGRMLGILSSRRIPSVETMTPEQSRRFLAELPVAKLPEGDWSWPNP